MLAVVQGILFIVQVGWIALVGYLLLLTAAAQRAERRTDLRPGRPSTRFAVLIPAHNEDRLLPGLLANLSQLDYPAGMVSVHVVADNCTDGTAAIAERGGAAVHVRCNLDQIGKGYALNWLVHEIKATGEAYDAVVIMDADSLVSSNFLQVMAARLERGERAIQGYYSVREPGRSLNGSLRYLALAALHYLRPLGRMGLGGSAGLKGNGMVLAADLLEKYAWSPAVTEDIEYHMALLLDGERVTFAPDAVVWGEMPDTFDQSTSQQARWEGGRIQMARIYIPALIRASWKAFCSGDFGRAFLLFDALVEHILPPFSVFAGISLALLAADLALLLWADLLFGQRASGLVLINLALGSGILFGQLFYLLAALHLAGAPKSVYRKLVYAPVYMIWKTRHYLSVLFGQKQQNWVRTTRNES